MNFRIKESNLTALPFGLLGNLPRGIFQQYILEEKEILKEEETFEPFGYQLDGNQKCWALVLQNRFEVYGEYELAINRDIYRITLYKLFEEEKLSIPFRGRNFAFAVDSSTWLVLVKKDTQIQLKREEVDALLILFGSISSNNKRIQMIAKMLSKLEFQGELRHLKISPESKQAVMSRLISQQIRIKLRILSGAQFSTALTIDSSDHTDIIEPLENQGFQFEEERKDGYLSIGNRPVYSKVTESAGLHIRNKIDIGILIGTLLEFIIPSTYIEQVVRASSIEFEIRALAEEDNE
ncbi:MAG: hypothetical protein ACTSP3_05025 [Candidatus Heimdallarchaeaceae archaeon]